MPREEFAQKFKKLEAEARGEADPHCQLRDLILMCSEARCSYLSEDMEPDVPRITSSIGAFFVVNWATHQGDELLKYFLRLYPVD